MLLSARWLLAAAASAAVAACLENDRDRPYPSGPIAPSAAAPPGAFILVGAGNIARCTSGDDEATAALLDSIPGTVFTVGDNASPGGTLAAYQSCYGPGWGRHLSRTRPALGNRDYDSSTSAAGSFNYFGAAAGDPGKGYYSYDLGAWHVIVLNSVSAYVATSAGSPQEQWLRADLAAHPAQCTLAMWHRPRFYSTTASSFWPTDAVKPFWDDLYAAGADLIINAHMRDYERFGPQTPSGAADPTNGMREIIVGTGGDGLDAPNTLRIPNSEVNLSGVFGVLQLTLFAGSYAWQFIPVAGENAGDSGSAPCHHASPNGPPVARPGGPYAGAVGDTIRFDGGGSSDPDGDAIAYVWNFGDGSTGTGATPAHVYVAAATFTATLVVTDSKGAQSPPATTTATIAAPPQPPASPDSVLLVAAGNIASCGGTRAELTAQILDTIPGTVLTLGDAVFPDASYYVNCYDPSWGRHKARTYNTLGNHDTYNGHIEAVWDYWGDRAGPRDLGYYSFDVGAWHIVVLNSNLTYGAANAAAASAQDVWLENDLAANTKRCTLAAFHQPLFFSSEDVGWTEEDQVKRLWNRLYAADADLVLNGQQHQYERLTPMTPAGVVDTVRGLRSIDVGTGGESTALPVAIHPNSEVISDAFGVLKLTLYADRYSWEFVPMQGEAFTDRGTGRCH